MIATEQLPTSPSSTQKSAPPHVKFGAGDGFHRELRARVDRYFDLNGIKRRDCPRMYVKTGIILSWLAVSFVLLLCFGSTWWCAGPLALSLGLATAAVGFNIQHDGNHGAYSERPWINKLCGLTLDLMGGSSYVWARKHNAIHHSYTNITGHDEDINVGLLGRLSPHQPRLGFHRFQHFYLWGLYCLLPIKWYFFDDFRDVILGRIGQHRFKRPRGWDLVTFLGGKLAFFSLAFVLPLMLHPWYVVLSLYLLTIFVQGLTLSVVFQLAHCVEEAEFFEDPPAPHRIEAEWAKHQVETTVDFGRSSRFLSWLTGGLNFQIEHHLFPKICHIHYSRLSRLVEKTSKEFSVKYTAHKSFWAGVASHHRWLRRMGASPA